MALVEENDVFNLLKQSDRDYTQGGTFAVTLPEGGLPAAVAEAVRAVPGMGGATSVHLGVLAGQQIYTPENIETARAIKGDRPYAGWLYAGLAVQAVHLDGDAARRRDRVDHLELDLGVVGPNSGAHHAQDQVHVIIHSDRPQGWDNQLRNETAGLLRWERRRRVLYGALEEGLDGDIISRATVRLGNAHADVGGGVLARFGWGLQRDFGPAPVDGARLTKPGEPHRWHAHFLGGISGRAVAHSIFLDGNSGSGSPSVTRRPLVGEIVFGASAGWGPLTLTYTQHVRSPEFSERRRFHRFASLLLEWTFLF